MTEEQRYLWTAARTLRDLAERRARERSHGEAATLFAACVILYNDLADFTMAEQCEQARQYHKQEGLDRSRR